MVFIKNNKTEEITLVGVKIQPSEYYAIPELDRLQFSSNDIVVSNIADNSITVSKSDDGLNDIDGINESIDYLKNNIPKEVSVKETKPFLDAQGFRARFRGFSGLALAGQVSNIDYEVTEDRFINGIRIITKNHNFGDCINFQIVDKDYSFAGTLYPADHNGTPWSVAAPTGVVLDEFGSDWYLAEDIQCQVDVNTPYPAKIQSGMTIRMQYKSTGTTDVEVRLNLYLHWKAS